MSDSNRLDLSNDLDSLLQDVKAATEEVKQRKEKDKLNEARAAEKEKSRKLSTLIIAAAAAVLLMTAYFTVFARPAAQEIKTQAPPVTMVQPHVGVTTPNADRSSNQVNMPPPSSAPQTQPSNDYEQPSNGM